MTAYLVPLRGINVGGKNKVPWRSCGRFRGRRVLERLDLHRERQRLPGLSQRVESRREDRGRAAKAFKLDAKLIRVVRPL